ncbi:hypothetical protein LCGC14_1330250 [marine sediment metagenome]|uniref:site-specific DNA-methyltransferase (cytosine-N(4)-specific) n=1 Tax=marine sediment metagenome TaxID=412755 RepID=A0A0F9KGV2_9ZZZZ
MWKLTEGEALDVLKALPDNSVDLVFTSPPYEDSRTYGIDYKLRGQEWVDWAFERYVECVRVSRGLVAWVVGNKTRNFKWTAVAPLLIADLHRAGVCLRNPPIFHRVGVPGSGGPDWLRADTEWIICATPGGKLPWSDNTATGHPPKYAPGGAMSNRTADGRRKNAPDKPEALAARINQWGRSGSFGTKRQKKGSLEPEKIKPSHCYDGTGPPVKANPGNLISCPVGGGVMGSRLCHENEAPFPEKLAEFFIRSFCPPNGWVLDPFVGSGTTIAVAQMHGRHGHGVDCRASQIELTKKRLGEL